MRKRPPHGTAVTIGGCIFTIFYRAFAGRKYRSGGEDCPFETHGRLPPPRSKTRAAGIYPVLHKEVAFVSGYGRYCGLVDTCRQHLRGFGRRMQMTVKESRGA